MTSTRSHLEFVDFRGKKVTLTNYYYQHIIEEHGSGITSYSENWIDTLQNPDYFGNSKSISECEVYAQKNNRKRNYPAKFLVIVVNGCGLITSIRFGRNLNFIKNIEEIRK